MKEEKLLEYESKDKAIRKRERDLFLRWARLDKVAFLIDKPSGIFTKKCPWCGCKLTKLYDENGEWAHRILWSCPNCEYEYASTSVW
jgi:hypothetical protein